MQPLQFFQGVGVGKGGCIFKLAQRPTVLRYPAVNLALSVTQRLCQVIHQRCGHQAKDGLPLHGPVRLPRGGHDHLRLSGLQGRLADAAVPALFGLFVFFLWEVAVRGFGVPAVLMPAPSAILAKLAASPAVLGEDFVQTILRGVLAGYVIGCGAGLAVAVLACARIGAVHSVVFGAFSADSLVTRINDSTCKLIITQDTGVRGTKLDIPMKANADKAAPKTPSVEKILVVRRTGTPVEMQSGRDTWWHDALAAAAPTGNPVADIAHQFGVNWQLLISQIILFVIVALALKKFAYAPILEMLEQRRTRIAESLANADKIKSELANAQAKSQELIGQASQQAQKIIEEARAAAAKVAEVERQKAIADAASIIAKAKQANDAELARMKGELRQEFGRLVVAAASRATGDILNADQKGRLADDAVRQLAA